jgi:competence protein ComGC
MVDFVTELWAFLSERKKLWLAPMLAVILVIGALLILAQSSVIAPFIYALF